MEWSSCPAHGAKCGSREITIKPNCLSASQHLWDSLSAAPRGQCPRVPPVNRDLKQHLGGARSEAQTAARRGRCPVGIRDLGLRCLLALFSFLTLAFALREGRSNAHLRGDYQRIGDVMLNNIQGMKVSWGVGWPRSPERRGQGCTRHCIYTRLDLARGRGLVNSSRLPG